ncbi:glycosyl transferase [Pectobacterium carotovorum subsp. carotovorum]|nr:glycosyl transferase [Pectobacterium carotovorum subsp. carotovorum]
MNIIFHHPLPLNFSATSASGIRPVKMLQAFESLGYNVYLVTGFSSERKEAIKKIKTLINEGVKFDFVYSESSTMPTVLTEPHHFPLHPFLDFLFFSFLKKRGVKIGLFYRDIYWIFNEYGRGLNFFKIKIAKFFYRYDLFCYQRLVNKLYIPSFKMGNYIPIVDESRFSELPPGHNAHIDSSPISPLINNSIRLLYVGGMSEHYQMHKAFDSIKQSCDISFTICTRDNEWKSIRFEYEELISDKVLVVHESGESLNELYQQCDIAMLFVKPHEYWKFASPVKLYEYLGKGKPIIATQGTLAGEFVEENEIGWTIPYSTEKLCSLISYLKNNNKEIEKMKKNCRLVAINHSWIARASKVAKDLE